MSRKSIRFGTITIEALTREVARRTSFCGSVTGKTTPPSTAGYGSPFCPTGSQSPVGADIGVCYTLRLELAGLLAREQRRLFSSGAGIGNGPLPFQWSIPGSRRNARFQGRGSGGAHNLEKARGLTDPRVCSVRERHHRGFSVLAGPAEFWLSGLAVGPVHAINFAVAQPATIACGVRSITHTRDAPSPG